jgi:hypothetical protein
MLWAAVNAYKYGMQEEQQRFQFYHVFHSYEFLTVYTLMVTICTTYCDIKKLQFVHTVYVCMCFV